MIIRIGTVKDLMALWRESNNRTYYIDGIKNGQIEPWFLEDEGLIIGELYIFWDSIDKDEANGKNRAYLAAFRINKVYHGQGLGKMLMNAVFDRIKEKQYQEITIGVESNNPKLMSMYNHYGFNKLVKHQTIDLHCIDKFGNPLKEDVPVALLLKEIK